MKNKSQSSKYAKIIVKKIIQKNKNTSLSRLYKRLRFYRRLSSLGDYFILGLIISSMFELGIKPERNKLRYAYNQSSELKANGINEKRDDLNQLLNYKKSLKFPHASSGISKHKEKDDHSIVKNSKQFNYA